MDKSEATARHRLHIMQLKCHQNGARFVNNENFDDFQQLKMDYKYMYLSKLPNYTISRVYVV
jgi:hypothetical protein